MSHLVHELHSSNRLALESLDLDFSDIATLTRQLVSLRGLRGKIESHTSRNRRLIAVSSMVDGRPETETVAFSRSLQESQISQ